MDTAVPTTHPIIKREQSDFNDRTYKLQPVQIDESDEEFDYDEVSVDSLSQSDVDEDLEMAVHNAKQRAIMSTDVDSIIPKATLERSPEVIDDFIRNYLSNKGLKRTLECFQNEWYEKLQKGQLGPEDVIVVPDVYRRNLELEEGVNRLRLDVEEQREIANQARATYDRLRKERDFHGMHHKRVVQEKSKLIADIKRLKRQYENFDPTLKQLQKKYEMAMKEKMLTKLEKDRLFAKVESLENSLKRSEQPHEQNVDIPVKKNDRNFAPSDDRLNPFLNTILPMAKSDGYKLKGTCKAHELAISSIKFHPKKKVLATVSDDKNWKLWTFPGLEPVMSGSGHKEWISDCDFHPKGTVLATSSGDTTVKLWDFSRGQSSLTLQDHTQCVWACAFHDQGEHLVSCSMDQTSKLWDIRTGKCRQTFRGHTESVNHVCFIPFTSTFLTCSGDKTVSLWDMRANICVQTLYGHLTAINHVATSLQGTSIASCDANGVVKFWDIKKVAEVNSLDMGPSSANKLSFDPSGKILAVASNDGASKLYHVFDGITFRDLACHDEGVQSALFDRTAEYLVTAGAEGLVKVWN